MSKQSKPDVICFSLFRTDNPYSSISLRMSKVWARESRVFYINHPYSYKDIYDMRHDANLKRRLPELLKGRTLFESLPEIPNNFVSVTPRLTYPINWLPKGQLYDILWRSNNNIILQTIREVINKYQVNDFIYFNCFNPFYAGSIPKSFGARVRIYDCVDDISEDAYTRKHAVRLEQQAIENADITLCTSIQLQRKYKQINERCFLLQNAVEIGTIEKALIHKFPKPEEWTRAKGRILGFVGNLDHLRIDYRLLRRIAEHYRNDTLALVGPINSRQFYDEGLDKIPNVICSGSQPYSALPAYMQHMDVTLIPFLCNKLTQSIYPLKVNEYLAAGKPVVSTDFSEDIRTFKDHIYLADSADEFIKLIDVAIIQDTPERAQERLAVAKTNTWEARIDQLWEIIEQYEMQTATSMLTPHRNT